MDIRSEPSYQAFGSVSRYCGVGGQKCVGAQQDVRERSLWIHRIFAGMLFG